MPNGARVEPPTSDPIRDEPLESTLKVAVEAVLQSLTFREREIIKLRFGLDKEFPFTFTYPEVGRIFKVQPRRAKFLETRALRKLKHPTRSKQLEPFRDLLLVEGPTEPRGFFYLVQTVLGRVAAPRPNLFTHATRELSQDAFFCWLAEWADRRHREADEPLHLTGVKFLHTLLSLHGIDPPDDFEHVQVKRQFHGLDILLLTNGEFAVLIEDKTDTSEHSDQLRRYSDVVRAEFPTLQHAPVYLKVGEQVCLAAVEAAGWKCVLRPDVLRILGYGRKLGVTNPIFTDYHDRLMWRDLRSWMHRSSQSPAKPSTGGLFD